MQRKLDLWMTASNYKLELEDIIFTITELIDDGAQHGIIDKENKEFYPPLNAPLPKLEELWKNQARH